MGKHGISRKAMVWREPKQNEVEHDDNNYCSLEGTTAILLATL